MKQFIISLIALNSIFFTAKAEVIETSVYSSVLNNTEDLNPEDTLFVTDLDNTVIMPKQTLGSDQWGEYTLKKFLNLGLNKEEAVKMQVSLFSLVNQKTEVVTVENNTSEVINKLQKMGITTIGLTARPLYLANRTIDLLKTVNIQLTNKNLNIKITDNTVSYNDGVFFVGPFNNKGLVLKKILSLPENRHYKTVIFIDDKPHHAENVDKALKDLNIQIFSYRYSAADSYVKNFKSEIADLQWDIFQKIGNIISDNEASNRLMASEQNPFTYKILTANEFELFKKDGQFIGSIHDLRDGFIHLSTESQVPRVLNKYFSNEAKVYILKVDMNNYKNDIRWEPNSAGDLYPHLYNRPLVKEAVVSVETKNI